MPTNLSDKNMFHFLIGLEKDKGSVVCVILELTATMRYFDTQLHGILPWADINRNRNIFFQSMMCGGHQLDRCGFKLLNTLPKDNISA